MGGALARAWRRQSANEFGLSGCGVLARQLFNSTYDRALTMHIFVRVFRVECVGYNARLSWMSRFDVLRPSSLRSMSNAFLLFGHCKYIQIAEERHSLVTFNSIMRHL